MQFSYRALQEALKPDTVHSVDMLLCAQHNTEHRLSRFAHPWTNGQVEKMKHIINSATLKWFHYETTEDCSKHLSTFLNYYKFGKKSKRLKFNYIYSII